MVSGSTTRTVSALAYLPLPAFGYACMLMVPGSRRVRFHAIQGGTTTLAAFLLLAAIGNLPPAVAGPLAGALLVLLLAGLLIAGAGAAQGKYTRLRPVWDAVVLLYGVPKRNV